MRRLTDHPQDGGFGLPETEARVVAATKRLEKETANFNRLQDRQRDTTAAWQAASAPKVGCDDLLRHGVPGGCTLEPAIEVEPTLLKGESIIDAVERFRRRGRELRADAHRIRSSPYPSAHAKRKMREQIEQLSQRGEPSVSRLVELDGPVEFQTQNLKSTVHGEQRALAFAETPDALALIAWLHKDALIKRLDAEIDVEADDGTALSHEAREKAEAEVMSDLLDIERQEAELTWLAQSQNLPVEHRADISPLALLGVALVTTPRAEAPETTQGYSHGRARWTTRSRRRAHALDGARTRQHSLAQWSRSGGAPLLQCVPPNQRDGGIRCRDTPRPGDVHGWPVCTVARPKSEVTMRKPRRRRANVSVFVVSFYQ